MPTDTMNTQQTTRKSTYRPPKDEAEAQRRREYARAYRAAHRDKVRKWNQRFYLKQAAKALEQAARIVAATGEGEVK